MNARTLAACSVAVASLACESFESLGVAAACRNQLPRCPTLDAGTVDAGTVDAGTVDAGTVDAGTSDAGTSDAGTVDAGTVDAGVVDAGVVDAGAAQLVLSLAWTAREGGLFAGARPFRSHLAAMDGGLVLWAMSTVNPTDVFDGPPKDLVGGYAVAVDVGSGSWLLNDGGLGPRSSDAALSYLTSYVSPLNVTAGRATLAKAELLLDGGEPRYSDGGTLLSDGGRPQFSNRNATQLFSLDVREVRGSLLSYDLAQLPLAAGPLSLLDGGRTEATVLRGATGTQLTLAGQSIAAHPCQALPLDVVTTHDSTVGLTVDRLLTLSVCAEARVLAYSAQVALGDLSLGPVTSARMGIAPEGTSGRAPCVAASSASALTVYRLTPAGTAVAARVPLVTRGPIPAVEAVAVDTLNRPVLVLRAPRGELVEVAGLRAPVASAAGLLVLGLGEDLQVRWGGPVVLANGEALRASAAVFSEGRLVVALECAAASDAGVCTSLSPALARVGPFPLFDLP